MVRVPVWALKYSLSYRRARKEFKHHLVDQGVPLKEAEELTKLFPFKMRDIIDTVRNLG
jgi:hypothetical protein